MIKFDIVDYYPSLSWDLFTLDLEFANEYSYLSNEEQGIIMNSKKSIFIYNKEQCIKNNSCDQFDIAMGTLDSAESSELVGLFIL